MGSGGVRPHRFGVDASAAVNGWFSEAELRGIAFPRGPWERVTQSDAWSSGGLRRPARRGPFRSPKSVPLAEVRRAPRSVPRAVGPYSSIHIPLVSLGAPQRLQIRLGFGGRPGAGLHDDLLQGGIYIGGHPFGVAADVDVGARFEPAPQFDGLLEQPMLHVDLVHLVAGERRIKPRE